MILGWIEAKQFYAFELDQVERVHSLLINRPVAEGFPAITITDVESFPSVRRAVGKSWPGHHQIYVAL